MPGGADLDCTHRPGLLQGLTGLWGCHPRAVLSGLSPSLSCQHQKALRWLGTAGLELASLAFPVRPFSLPRPTPWNKAIGPGLMAQTILGLAFYPPLGTDDTDLSGS